MTLARGLRALGLPTRVARCAGLGECGERALMTASAATTLIVLGAHNLAHFFSSEARSDHDDSEHDMTVIMREELASSSSLRVTAARTFVSYRGGRARGTAAAAKARGSRWRLSCRSLAFHHAACDDQMQRSNAPRFARLPLLVGVRASEAN